MVDFVPKPVDPDDLVRVLRRWLPKTLGEARDDTPMHVNAAQDEPAKRRALPGKYVVRAEETPRETLQKVGPVTVPEAPPATASSLALEGFDEAAALRLLHGNREKLRRLLRSFANTHREAGVRLRALLDSGDAAEARQVVHALHGSAAMLGLGRVASLGREIDVALRDAGSTLAILPEIADFCG